MIVLKSTFKFYFRMKIKWIITLSLCLLIQNVGAQPLNGSGTYGNPYNGIFQSDLQWNTGNFASGKVYINGDVTIDNELLSVGPGITIVFLAEGSDIIINGTGRIEALGTSLAPVLFTSDDDDDGNYGETGERWGHLAFMNPSSANQSRFDYCTFEYGDVRTGSNTTSFGGAVYSTVYSNLVFNNCTFRNNKATHGGGLLFNDGASPSLTNCIITNNSATTTGGGIYSLARNGLSLKNCIIAFNTAIASTGGGVFLDGADNSRFINCTIVNNTSSGGRNIQLYSIGNITPRPSFINSIVWGSDNSIEYSGISIIRPADFVNSAIQDISTPAATFTNCIDLSSSNLGVNGPNFIATDGSDWSISFISPALDKGTTPVPSLPTDIIGNPRINLYDIGAYEVQYRRWKTTATTTDWNNSNNWEGGVPANNTDVVIPSGALNYPTITTTQDFTIGNGKYFILEPAAMVTLDELTNNGTLRLRSSASGIASLILNSYVDNGTEEIDLFLSGGGTSQDDDYKWHYISVPVASVPVSTFTGVTLDLAGFAEPRVSFDVSQGWVAFDGYVYSTGGDEDAYSFSNLVTLKGYNFLDSNDQTFTFSGSLITAQPSPLSLTYGGNASYSGWNLIGNPYSSGINWDAVIADSYPDNTGQAVHFTKNNAECIYAAGIGIPAGTTSHIPPMQGFFVRTTSTGNSFTVPVSAKEHNSQARYKGEKTEIPMLRLQLAVDNNTDEAVIRFDSEAKTGFDLKLDAAKAFSSTTQNLVYSVSEGKKYAINSLPFPVTDTRIPIVVNITRDGTNTINATEINNIDGYNVYLKDNVTGFTANLRETPTVSFSSATGTITDRFELQFSDIITGSEDLSYLKDKFNIYQSFGKINIQTLSDEWGGRTGTVRVLDLTGKTIAINESVYFETSNIVTVDSPSASGIYMVEVVSGTKRYVSRVFISSF